MKHGGCVYIITNQYNKVLYTGVTAELKARIWDHKTKEYQTVLPQNTIAIKLSGTNVFQQLKKQLKEKSRSKVEAGEIKKY